MADDAVETPVRRSSDFARTYVWGMGAIALLLVVAWIWARGERNAYRTANELAPLVLGSASATAPAAGSSSAQQRPTTIRGLAVGIHKYLQTFKEAKVTVDDAVQIPLQKIKDRASGVGLTVRTSLPGASANRTKGYEEVYATCSFEPTDLQRLATFMYNFEVTSTKLRFLEMRWDLRQEKSMPYNPFVQPGHLIQGPTVKIGFRRPLGTKSS